MFPSLHGIVDQVLSQGGAPPAADGWLWPALPGGAAQSVARSGFQFTPTTPLLAKRFRLGSNSGVINNRIMHLYTADSQEYLTGGAANGNTQVGWVEMPPDMEVVLYAGRPYILVAGHAGGSPTRVATAPVSGLALDARVAFDAPVTSTSASQGTFPVGGSGESVVAAVDILADNYAPPTGDGWAARIEQFNARNDIQQGGWAFTPKAAVTATKVRVYNNGNSANYTVRIWRESDQALLSSVTFNATGLTETNLPAPVALAQGETYVISASRNTSTIIRLWSDLTTGAVIHGSLNFVSGRSSTSYSAFPSTVVNVWQGVDLFISV